jgi:phosphate-selective porin
VKFKHTIIAASLMAAGTVANAAPSNEELWKMMQDMQGQMQEVQTQNQQLKAENMTLKTKVEETEQAVEAVVVATEEAVNSPSFSGKNTTIGGYGELHFNNLEDKNGDSDKDQLDFHRFVLFVGHEFTDDLRFFSELELEHSLAGDGKPGEVELEQAYIEYDMTEQHRVKGGLFLLPVGILNETHEPDTFYGTERNAVEKNIIPTTWWEGGVMFSGNIANGFAYDLAVHSGLDVSKEGTKTSFKIRDGRQKVAKAQANDLAYTGRLKWTAIPGVELGATVQYQEDITQGNIAGSDGAVLFETHAVIQRGAFGLRALYAQWDLEGDAPEVAGYDEQMGWYVEPSYKINEYFGVFARYSEWDNQAGSSAIDSEFEQIDLGINWWPHKNVVVKLDYQFQDAEDDTATELEGLNIGLGYQF